MKLYGDFALSDDIITVKGKYFISCKINNYISKIINFIFKINNYIDFALGADI